jgi:hypothetical protein
MKALQALTLLVAVGVMAIHSANAAESTIGVAAAVKNDVRGTINGAHSALAVGSNLFQGEVVQTGDASQTELLFNDQTNLSVGAKSTVTLDKFIFDPNRGTGEVVLNASLGAFRFVTGSQDPKNYSIKTPTATIGVRGTINRFYISPENLQVVHEEGETLIFLLDGTVVDLTERGSSFTLAADGTRTEQGAGGGTPLPSDNKSDITDGLTPPGQDKFEPVEKYTPSGNIIILKGTGGN